MGPETARRVSQPPTRFGPPQGHFPQSLRHRPALFQSQERIQSQPCFPGKAALSWAQAAKHPPKQQPHRLSRASRPLTFQKMVACSPMLLLLNLLSFTCKRKASVSSGEFWGEKARTADPKQMLGQENWGREAESRFCGRGTSLGWRLGITKAIEY